VIDLADYLAAELAPDQLHPGQFRPSVGIVVRIDLIGWCHRTRMSAAARAILRT
jgi:hypothetical protein